MSQGGVNCETCYNRYFLGRGCPYCKIDRLRKLLGELVEAAEPHRQYCCTPMEHDALGAALDAAKGE